MDNLEQIVNSVLPHWPGIAWMVIAAAIGQVMTKSVFTKTKAHTKSKYQWFWWWMRKTLPLHPVGAGFVLGLMWRNPEGANPAWGAVASAIYFGAFGGGSTWVYETAKGLLEKKGIDIDGPDSVPPPHPRSGE